MNPPLPASHPSLFQANTRVRLTEMSHRLGRPATLDDVSDAELDWLAKAGFDWLWLLSVWQTGPAARAVSRSRPEWRKEFQATLPDLTEDDIAGSGFAITGYTVHEKLGGDAALARLRERLRQRGLKLMLDFVPNHLALDHPWVETHPEYFIEGTEPDLAHAPMNWIWIRRQTNGIASPRPSPPLHGGEGETASGVLRPAGDRLLAHGRDPYFPGWPDTLQLNYANPALQEAMTGELLRIASQCDGVRCDMAMLVLPEVFERTWGQATQPFWPEAIRRVREKVPGFCFMAEVYWDLEWPLQQQGFDYTYDKRLYDRLIEGQVRPVREHFLAAPDYQDKLARFLENHDEPRAAHILTDNAHRAAAVITFLVPGLRFFHQGQFEGRCKRISPHLVRAPQEPMNASLKKFYQQLLEILRRPVVRRGRWRLLECVPAWEENRSCDHFIVFDWQDDAGAWLLVTVNYSSQPAQCYVRLPFAELAGHQWQLRDLMGEDVYHREGDDLNTRGLYLAAAPWQRHAFEMKTVEF